MSEINTDIEWPEYQTEKPTLKPIVQGYEVKSAEWQDVDFNISNIETDRLTILTWNTWFQKQYWEERHEAIVNILKQSDADVVMLQEVNVELLDKIRADKWIQENYQYVRSAFKINSVPTHGLVLLSRYPINYSELFPLPTYIGRYLLIAKFQINNQDFSVVTVHLESMENSQVRGKQPEKIFDLLNETSNVLLAGDFNFCSSWTEENNRLDPSYLDLWTKLKPNHPGFTQDTEINEMLNHAKGKKKQVRIDRILLKSEIPKSQWKPESIQLLGTSAVYSKFNSIFPSDHFGLLAKISHARR